MKSIEINEELLAEVLGIQDIVHVQEEGTCSIFISRANNPAYIINIYEFVFKCKEWAWNNFRLNIFIEKHSFDLYEASVKICSLSSGLGPYNSFIDCYKRENTEIEAIVKACECIMKKIKSKK